MMQVCALLLTMAALSAGTEVKIRLSTVKNCTSDCNCQASLLCSIKEEDIVNISWTKYTGELLCDENGHVKTANDERMHCHYDKPQKHLNLTIWNLNETDSGLYICKVMSTINHHINNTTLNVTACHPDIGHKYRRQSGNSVTSPGAEWGVLGFLLTVIFFILQ